MVSLNIESTFIYNIGVEIFSIIIVLIIIFALTRDFLSTYDTVILRKLNHFIMFVLISDLLTWILNGHGGDLAKFILYPINMLYYFAQFIVINYWLKYAWYRIYGTVLDKKKYVIFVLIPLSLLSVNVMITPLTKLIFYLDDKNLYTRGILAAPTIVFSFSYLIIASIIALVERSRSKTSERKRELNVIAFFVAPPLACAVIQTLFYGISIIWPAAVISSLLILVEKESREVLQDPLTKLNNRRNLERQFNLYEENQYANTLLFLFDINEFKQINDKFGHDSGDQALINIADLLRETFGKTNAFISRYGGDEFVVLLPGTKKDVAREIINGIKSRLDKFNDENTLPFPLSVSAGYAFSDRAIDMREMFKQADEAMYLEKGGSKIKEPHSI